MFEREIDWVLMPVNFDDSHWCLCVVAPKEALPPSFLNYSLFIYFSFRENGISSILRGTRRRCGRQSSRK